MGDLEEGERLVEGMSVLDFDMLCSAVASQTHKGKWANLENLNCEGDEDGVEYGGGVLRMWKGEVLDCFEDRRIAIQSACCMMNLHFAWDLKGGNFHILLCFIDGMMAIALAPNWLSSHSSVVTISL